MSDGFSKLIALLSSTSASENQKRFAKRFDVVGTYMKLLTGVRVFVANSNNFGHQASSVTILRRLIQLGLTERNQLELVVYADDGNFGPLDAKLKVLIADFKSSAQPFTIGKVTVTATRLAGASTLKTQAEFGITGGYDDTYHGGDTRFSQINVLNYVAAAALRLDEGTQPRPAAAQRPDQGVPVRQGRADRTHQRARLLSGHAADHRLDALLREPRDGGSGRRRARDRQAGGRLGDRPPAGLRHRHDWFACEPALQHRRGNARRDVRPAEQRAEAAGRPGQHPVAGRVGLGAAAGPHRRQGQGRAGKGQRLRHLARRQQRPQAFQADRQPGPPGGRGRDQGRDQGVAQDLRRAHRLCRAAAAGGFRPALRQGHDAARPRGAVEPRAHAQPRQAVPEAQPL